MVTLNESVRIDTTGTVVIYCQGSLRGNMRAIVHARLHAGVLRSAQLSSKVGSPK